MPLTPAEQSRLLALGERWADWLKRHPEWPRQQARPDRPASGQKQPALSFMAPPPVNGPAGPPRA